MSVMRIIRRAVAATMAVIILTLASTAGLTQPVSAQIGHGHPEAGCCVADSSSSQRVAVILYQHPQEEKQEQDTDPDHQPPPHYLAFVRFLVPPTRTSQTSNSADILRPPDLITLYANYRS